MSSEDNFLFSKTTSNKSSGEVQSLAIDYEEELIDFQSIVPSTGTISVFDVVTESVLDDNKSTLMASMHSSMQGSLPRRSSFYSLRSSRQSFSSPRHSIHSPRQSLNLTIQSLNEIQSLDKKANDIDKANDKAKRRKSQEDKTKEQELRRKDKILAKVQYGMYSFLSIFCAFVVMIIWYTSWLEDKTITNEIGNEQTDIKVNANNSTCQVWDITGDGFCDDEANIAECGYDFKDCCQMGNDRTVCEDCFCFVPEDEKASIREKPRPLF